MLASNSAMFGVLQQWDAVHIRREHQLVAQLAHQVLVTGFLSIWPPVIVTALGATISATTFCAWWAFLWLVMATLGFVIVTLLRTLGIKIGSALHSLFLLINFVTSPAVCAPEIAPSFLRVGRGLILYSAMQGSRNIVFGSYDVLDRCIGIILAWAFGTLTVLYMFVRRQRITAAAVAGELAAGAESADGDMELRSSVDTESEVDGDGKERNFLDNGVRVTIVKTVAGMGIGLVALCALFTVMLLLFIGVGWQTRNYYGNIHLAVLDLDGGIIGSAIVAIASSGLIPFTTEVLPVTTPIDELRARIDAGDWNAALVAQTGSSHALLAAATNPVASYAASNATIYIFDQGRGGASMAAIIRTTLAGAVSNINSLVFSSMFAELAKQGVPLALMNPTVVENAVGTTEDNLHPVTFSGEYTATELGIEFLEAALRPTSCPISILLPTLPRSPSLFTTSFVRTTGTRTFFCVS